MTIPAQALSLPASQVPAVLTTWPSRRSFVSSPRDQTLPFRSCTYQSKDSSTSFPSR